MARIFISHAGGDREPTAEVQRWLLEDGHEVFLDRDLADGIPIGDVWEQRLHERLRWCDAVVCVVTSAYLASTWCAAEVGAARSRGCRVLPVVAEPGVVHPLLRSVQHTDMARDADAARLALSAALRRVESAGGAGWPDGRSPFPGLVSFDRALRRVFFGRSAEIERLVEVLRSPVERAEGGMLLVVGPSGSGKSSLVRAGLVPAIGEEPGWWTVPPFVPGADPVGALARELAAEARRLGLGWTVGRVRNRLGESGFVELAEELLEAAPEESARSLLVVVDQFEELLTRTGAAERARFVDVLQRALTGPVHVVATLRSEFVDRLLTESELAVVPARLHPVRPLHRESLREVIEGPARFAGIRVDDELVARLIADTGTGAALPLLAFTLSQLAVGAGRGDELSAARYDQLGGVQGALSRQADAALADAVRVAGRSREDVLDGLLRLVTVDQQGSPTGWRVYRRELPDPVAAELDAFVARRLLVTDTGEDGSAVIGVAHEAFLTAWPPLRHEIDSAASALRARRAVEQGAEEWDRSGRPGERLWEGGRLAAAVADTGARIDFTTETPDAGDTTTSPRGIRAVRLPLLRPRAVETDRIPLSPTASAFLLASIRRDRLRRGRATAILSVLCVLALVAAGIAVMQGRAAQEEQRVATARQLIAQADLVRDSEPDTALRLDIAAERIHSNADTQAALVDAMLSSRFAGTLAGHGAEVRETSFTADQRTMATAGGDGTVILWDISGERPRPLGPPLTSDVDLVGLLEFSPDGRILAATRPDATIVLWDVSDPSAPRPIGRPVPFADGAIDATPLSGAEQYLAGLEYSPDGHILAVGVAVNGAEPSTVRLLDVSNPADARRLGEPVMLEGALHLLRFHSTGAALVIGSGNAANGGSVVVWNVTDPANPRPFGPPLVYDGKLTFSPEARLLAADTDPLSNAVTIWDLTDPATPRQRPGISQATLAALGFDDEVVDMLWFTPDAAMLGVVSRTNSGRSTVRLWEVTETGLFPRYRRWPELDGQIENVATNPDGAFVGINADGIVTMWDLADEARQLGQPIRGGAGGLSTVTFLPNWILLTSRPDGTMVLWDLTDPGTPRPLGPPIEGPSHASWLAFFPGPETLLIGYQRGVLMQHPVPGSAVAHPARQLLSDSFSFPPVFAPQTGLVAVADPDGSILVKDVLEASRVGRIPNPFPGELRDGAPVPAKPLGFSVDGRTLALSIFEPGEAEPGSSVALWDVTDPTGPRRLGETFVPNGNLDSYSHAVVAFSPDVRLLASRIGPSWSEVSLMDISEPTRPDPIGDPLIGHTSIIEAIAFSADGTLLATAGADRSIILWDVTDPAQPLRRGLPLNHPSTVFALAFSPDGRTMASGDDDGNVTIWDVADPAHPHRLVSSLPSPQGREGRVSALQFSPDGNVLAAGHLYTTTITWDLTELNALRRDPRQAACDRTGRGLDLSEWERYVSGLDYEDTCSG